MNPDFVYYENVDQYRDHYRRVYCCGVIHTFDGIRVYFSAQRFSHAFFISSNNEGPKNKFCKDRAMRIDWIKATLENPEAELYFGWNSTIKKTNYLRRVSVVYGDYVVIIEISPKTNKAKFVTAYVADSSINEIRSGEKWQKK